jgi:hypothetical protein
MSQRTNSNDSNTSMEQTILNSVQESINNIPIRKEQKKVKLFFRGPEDDDLGVDIDKDLLPYSTSHFPQLVNLYFKMQGKLSRLCGTENQYGRLEYGKTGGSWKINDWTYTVVVIDGSEVVITKDQRDPNCNN